MADESKARLSKNERRNQAREQARIAREQEKKREKRKRLYLQGGVVLGVIAILVIVGVVLSQTAFKPAGPAPANMASGGAVFTKDLKVVESPALEDGKAARVAYETDREQLPIDVTLYADYMCPGCGAFEQTNGTMLENYVGSGDITLQVYPINFLDAASLGTRYSTRAANLFSCVVEEQPDAAFNLHNRLLSAEVQPEEQSTGLSNDELLEQAELSGVEITDELKSCVNQKRFADFIDANTKAALETGIVGLAEGAQLLGSDGKPQPADGPQRITGTPFVVINGQQWIESRDGSLEEYLLKLKSQLEEKEGDSASEGSDSNSGDSAAEDEAAADEAQQAEDAKKEEESE